MSLTELSASAKDKAKLPNDKAAEQNEGNGNALADQGRELAFSSVNKDRSAGWAGKTGSLEMGSPYEGYDLAQKDGLAPPDRLTQLRTASDTLFKAQKYEEARAPLREELKLLTDQAKKEKKSEESPEFLKPNARLAHCLTEISAGKGSKEADALFEKAVNILDKQPEAKTPADKVQRQEYRALVQEDRGFNAFSVAEAANKAHNLTEAKPYYEKAEKALSDSLTLLNDPKYKDNPVRFRAAINLAQTESALGKQDAAKKAIETIKDHPAYLPVLSKIQTEIMQEVINKAKETSSTLTSADNEFKALPGKPQSKMIPAQAMPKKAPDSGYDGATSTLFLTDKVSQNEIPQKYANIAYVAAHQSLFEKFKGNIQPGAAGDTPIDVATYERLKRDQIAGGFAREVMAASELHVDKPIMYRIGIENKDLRTLAVKTDGAQTIDFDKSRTAIAKFIEGDKVAQGRWQLEHKDYVDHYLENKKAIFPILKPGL